MALGPHTVTRVRGYFTGPPYNEVKFNDPDHPATELELTGCSVQPGPPQGENFVDRDAVTTLFTVWAPGSPDVTERDRIVYAGTTYDVDGTIQRWDFGAGHVVIPLKAVSG